MMKQVLMGTLLGGNRMDPRLGLVMGILVPGKFTLC